MDLLAIQVGFAECVNPCPASYYITGLGVWEAIIMIIINNMHVIKTLYTKYNILKDAGLSEFFLDDE